MSWWDQVKDAVALTPEKRDAALNYLAPAPGATYGETLPFAQGGDVDARGRQVFFNPNARWAMPNFVRDALTGVVEGVSGEPTMRTANAVTMLGAGAGAAMAPRGSLAAGAAKLARPSEVMTDAEAKKIVADLGAGAGPLDLTGNQRIPGIEQRPIPRVEAARGVPARTVDALANPTVQQGVADSIVAGRALGAEPWYHNNALYQAFVKELGPEQGHRDFMKYMDYQSAASPRSDVSTNIRNASYYFVNEGKIPGTFSEMPPNPAPYGHLAQNKHRENADVVKANLGDWGGYDVFQNAKPPSYAADLSGNLLPVAADAHAFKNIGMRTGDPRFLATNYRVLSKTDPFAAATDVTSMAPDKVAELGLVQRFGEPAGMKKDKFVSVIRPQQLFKNNRLSMDEAVGIPTMWDAMPRPSEYAPIEGLYQRMGGDFGIAPAEAQSSAWAGGGNLTGLGTPPDRTFGQLHNERVLYTALKRGEDPQDTLRMLMRREKPLLSVAPPPVATSDDQPPGGLF